MIRVFAIVYFIRQALKYNRQKKEDKDPYTSATFLFFGISIFCVFFNRFFEIIYEALPIFNPSFQEDLKNILDDNLVLFDILAGIMRPGIGYLS